MSEGNGKAVMTREQFLKPRPRQRDEVPMPELGENVVAIVEGMTAGERSKFEKHVAGRTDGRARLLVQTVRDEHGRPMFTPDDAEAILGQPAAFVERLVDKALELSGLRAEDPAQTAGN